MNSFDKDFARTAALREEASIEPDPVSTEPAKKETQIIAIYGKGGIGKSFTLANIDRDDRIHYERVAQSSENLRRAMMRYYFKRNGW